MSAVNEAIKNDQRLQRRFDVSQAAMLTTSAGNELACEIHDFCLGGMFLRFDSPQESAELASRLHEGEDVEVKFTPPPAISQQTFRLRARLARRAPDGVGVAFVGTPIEATRTLNKVAAAMRTQRMMSKRYQGMDALQLQETCKTLLQQTVQDAAVEFHDLIGEKLTTVATQSTSFSERNDLMAAIDQIRMHAPTAQQVMQARLLAAFDDLSRPPRKPEPARDKASLSIVQTEEFEDWLNLTAEINKLEDRFSEELLALEPRLEKLYGRAVDRSNNPFAPSVIEHAAKAAYEGLQLPLSVRHVVYAAMREALVHPMGELLRQLDSVLPQADPPRQAATPPAMDGWSDTQGAGLDINPDSVMFVGGRPADDRVPEPATPARPAAAAPSAGGVAGALMNLFRRAQGAAQGGYPQGASAAAPMPAVGAPGAPQGAAAAAGATLPNAGHANAAVPAGSGSVAAASPAGVQAEGMPAAGGFGQRVAASSRRVVSELVAGGRVQPGQEAAAQGAADVFGVLAETIEAEKSLPGSVRHTIRQLEEPLLKLAVLDAGFLNSPQHPAHRVLNAVDRLAMVSSDDGRINDQKLLQVIERWTDRIKNEADRNPGIYEEARSQLEKVLKPLMRQRSIRIARLQAGLEGWQKMGQANRAISQEIQRRIDGRDVPELVLEFFNPGWRNYLIRVLLRHGANSPEEAEAWQAVDRLLEWLDPGLAEAPAFHAVQQLLTYIDSRLTLVSAGREVQENMLERLADGLFNPGNGAFKMLSGVKVATRQDVAEAELDEADAALIGQFRVGDWLSFVRAATPLNLIWIGDDPHVYVFSNYKGVRKLELKRQEFLDLLKSGEAKRTDNLDLPLMDRSFSSMIEHMHRNLVKQATNDPETGLMRRPEFMRRVKRAWLHVDGESSGCVMGVIDIEDLRMVQARMSPDGYRGLLRALAQHLNQKCSAGGFIARTGDRTFAFLRACQSEEKAQELAETFITRVNQFSHEWEGETFSLTANAGLAWASAYVEPETLYNKADTACLSAKHEGHNQLVFYREEDGEHKGHAGLAYWAGRFNGILASGRLYLRCQPIVALADDSGQPAHYEILLGARSDENEPIHIGDFVAAIERLKRISELDQWVVREVFEWIRSHPQEFEQVGAFSINLSGQSVNSKTFLGFMESELGRGDIPGHKLIFEITESAAIDSFANAEQFIKKFRRYGCRFSLDDFGVGFSSFTYLKNLKVDYLKIDGSFVRDMNRNEVDVALVSSMHETSRFLGIRTIAESVENEETLARLKAIGVNYVQGYLTGKPVHIDDIAA